MRKFRHIMTFALAASLGFGASVGCSDDDAAHRIVLDDEFYDNVPDDGPNQGGHEYVPKEDGWEVILVPAMVTDVDIANKGSAKLRVQLVSIVDDDTLSEGVADQSVEWGIEDASQLVSLKRKQTFTNEVGVADVTLTAGAVEGNVTVVASNERSPKPVRFNVSVGPIPTGSMRAIASYSGYAPVKNYNLRLFDKKDVDCTVFGPNALPTAEPLMSADSMSTTFKDLSVEGNYSVVAYGYAENGAMVALGCTTSGTRIFEKQTSEVYVPMTTINLELASTYHVRSYFDFGDIVSSLGSVGKMITMITDFAADPGGQLYNILWNKLIRTALESFIPSWVVGGITTVLEWTGIDSKIANYLNDFVKSTAIGCKIGLFGCQLRSIVRTMELTGDLSIAKVGDLQLRGTNAYSGLSVYWRIGCENNPDPNCGRLHYSMDSLNLGTQVNVLEGTWNGSLSNGYDRIAIESHDLAMYYGKLVIYLINEILLPRVTDNKAHNFNDAIAYWINCNSMATWLANALKLTVPDWVPVFKGRVIWDGPGWDTTYGWCQSLSSGLGSLLNFASSMAALQKLQSNVAISGSGLMKDTSLDNVVDIIDSGRWSGNMTLTTEEDGTTKTTSTAVKGIWSAYNKENNGYCTYDKTNSDSDDQSCAFPPIDTSELVNDGLCKDYAACAK